MIKLDINMSQEVLRGWPMCAVGQTADTGRCDAGEACICHMMSS